MGPPPKPSEAGSVGRGGPAEGMSFRVYAEANDPQLGPTMWGATTSARRLPAGMPPGRAAFLKVASLDFYRKRPRRLRRGGRTAFFPKESGGKERAGGVPPAPPKNGGSWRRWAVRTGQRPGVHRRPLRRHKLRIARFAASGKARSLHCASSPHRTRFAGLRRGPRYWFRYRRCRALGGPHRDDPANPESCCAVPGAPAGPPPVRCP